MMSPRRVLLLALLVSLALPSLAQAAVQPRFDLSTPDGGPFPSDRWTTFDWSQPTGLARQPAETGLCRAPVRLRRYRRPQHARRLQRPAADLDPVHRADRPEQRHELVGLPDPAARPRDHGHQPDRRGSLRRTRSTSSPTSCCASAPPTSSSSPTASATRAARRSRPRRSGATSTGNMSELVRGLPGEPAALRTSPWQASSRPRA